MRMTATKPGVVLVRQMLGGVSDAWDWEDSFAGDVRLAISEACNNVVVHAYRDDDPGELRLRLWADADSLVVAVADDGIGIGADSSSPDVAGLGLGLPLMQELAEDLTIRRENGAATELIMRFRRPASDKAPT